MAAASVSSSGMPCRPARKRITAKPTYFHVMITSRVQMAMLGSASQSCARPPRPTFVEQAVDARRCAWSMRLQPVPTTTSEMT